MKIFSFVFVALCTVGLVACVNEDISFEKGNISRDIAYKLVLKELKEWNISLNEVDIWASEQKVAGNTGGFGSDDNLTSPDSESWFFLVDERPLDNWGHPCRYLFVDMNGIVYVYQQTMPPKFFDDMVLLNVSETTKNYNYYPITPTKKGTRSEDIPLLSHHYAIIISGGWSSTLNFPRYWNDCAEIYTTLTDQYGYDPSKIFVLMADGTDPGIDNSLNESSNPDLDGDSIDDIDFAATCSNLDSVFDSLAVHLTTDDYLFIYTIDHGDIDWFLDDSFLAMWNNEKYFASRFANKVHSITAKAIHIVMGQCHSGGFVEYFTNTPNVCISTACGKYEDSHPSVNGLYDEYVHLWTQSHNTTISDANGDGKITAKESHLYAEFRDTCNETPCHYGGSGYLSERLTLTGTYQNTYDSYIDGYCVFNNLSNYSFYAGVHIHEPEFGIPSGGSVDIFLTQPNIFGYSFNWTITENNLFVSVFSPNNTSAHMETSSQATVGQRIRVKVEAIIPEDDYYVAQFINFYITSNYRIARINEGTLSIERENIGGSANRSLYPEVKSFDYQIIDGNTKSISISGSHSNTQTVELDISTLPKGEYTLIIKEYDTIVANQKLTI